MVDAPPNMVQEGNKSSDIPMVMHKTSTTFKDMLNSRNYSEHVQPSQSFTVDEEEVSDDDCAPEEYMDNPQCPAILLSKAEKIQMCRPWRSALILKMLNGKLGYMALMRRLKKKWSLKGDMTLTDIGCKFYIARFTNQEDYHHILTQGPWMIEDNYLTIRKWVPNLIPDESPIKVLTAWVRIPNLSVEYFDITFLHKIGSKIGKVLRIDKTTSNAERGQFTRLSVKIDLTKPLLSKFWLKGRIWKVQYEGLHLICFKCGCWGHNAQECASHPNDEVNMALDTHQQHAPVEDNLPKVRPELEETFGDWMLVRKPSRKRPPRLESKEGVGGRSVVVEPPPPSRAAKAVDAEVRNLNSKSPRAKVQLTSEIPGGGSRFSALEGDNIDSPILEEEVEAVIEKSSYATTNLGESSQFSSPIKKSLPLSSKIGKDKDLRPRKFDATLKPISCHPSQFPNRKQ